MNEGEAKREECEGDIEGQRLDNKCCQDSGGQECGHEREGGER